VGRDHAYALAARGDERRRLHGANSDRVRKLMIRRQGPILGQIGNDHGFAGCERTGAGGAAVAGHPPQATQRRLVEAAVLDERQVSSSIAS
jgi:hypothetical protein